MRALNLATAVVSGFTVMMLFFNPAYACGDNEYRGAFGWCYPKIGGVVGQGAEAAKHGDLDGFAKALGDVAIARTCPACAILGQNVVSRQDRETISTIVGRGIIIFTSQNPIPALLLLDSANRASTVPLAPQQPPISSSSPPPARVAKNYTVVTKAACLVANDGGTITGGWVTAPVLIDVSSGQPSTFPEVDLQKGDVIHATATPCDEASKAKLADNTPLTEASFSYEYPNTVPGAPSVMKFFLTGKKIS